MLNLWILLILPKALFTNLRDDSNQFLEFGLRSLGITLIALTFSKPTSLATASGLHISNFVVV